MAGDQPAKLCAACGKDVSNLPRTKDSQGRYICTTCQEQFKARKAAGPSAGGVAPAAAGVGAGGGGGGGVGGGGILDKLISESPMINAQKCPGCGDPMKAGSVLCLRCGYDVRAGRAMKTRVTAEKAPKDTGPVTIRRRGEFGPSFGVLFLIFFGLIGGLAALGTVSPMALGIALLIAVLVQAAGMIWGIFSAFTSGESTWGIIGVLSFIVPFVGLAFAYYLLVPNEDKWSKSLYASGLLGIILGILIAFSTYGGIEGLQDAVGP